MGYRFFPEVSGTGYQLNLRAFDEATAPLTAPFNLALGTELISIELAANGSGALVAAWLSGTVLEGRRATPTGPDRDAFDIGQSTRSYAALGVAIASDGTFWAIWTTTSTAVIRRFAGQGLSPDSPPADPMTGESPVDMFNGRIGMAGDDSFVIAWGQGHDIAAQRFSSTGTATGDVLDLRAFDGTRPGMFYPLPVLDLSANGTGAFVAVWSDWVQEWNLDDTYGTGIFARVTP